MRRAALLLLAALAGCGSAGSAKPTAHVAGDTRAATWVDPDGDGVLQRGPGEPLLTRSDLGGAGGAPAGRVLATLAQLTDAHVRDEESPSRTTFLDRLGDPFGSTFRPHEALSAQVLDGAARSVRAARAQLVVQTGDLTDNAQRNELELAQAVLEGGRVTPDSGRRGYEGPQQATNPDPSYYRPEVDPPQQPGLLTRAQWPFTARGVGAPIAAVPGNHDLLLQGEIAPSAETDAVATGTRLLTEPDTLGLEEGPRERAFAPDAVRQLLDAGLPGEARRVAADPDRASVTPRRWVARAAGVDGPRADRVVDLGRRVRVVLLDVSDRGSGGGSVKPGQAAFLREALDTDRWVLLATHQPLRKVAGARILRGLLDASPRVLATLAGDTHRSRVRSRPTTAGGHWELETSSLADFPMQTRALRVRELPGGGAALETWMLDAADTPLAKTARELAFLDAQGGRPQRLRGTRADRNVRLLKPAGR